MQTNTDKATRYNQGKLKWSYISFKALEPMIEVLMLGAKLYGDKNWQKQMDTTEILESMQRHLASLFDGEEFDKDSKLKHIGHIMANAMFYAFHKYKS